MIDVMGRHAADPPVVDARAAARVLVVCTGNICRSPAAERLLSAALGSGARVTSAGVRAVVGSAMTPSSARLVAGAGLDAGGFVARQLVASMVDEADLVLTMTRAHRTAVVELTPAAVRRTFTLRELARLADQVRADPTLVPSPDLAQRVRELPGHAARQRGRARSVGQDDDIQDPYGRDEAAYARAFAEIQDAVRRVTAALTV